MEREEVLQLAKKHAEEGRKRQEVTLIIDENLNKLKGQVLAPKKLAAANRSLKKLKGSLPK